METTMNQQVEKAFLNGMLPIHPGEILKEDFLVPENMSATSFANKLGMTPARICEILSGKRGITANTAIRIANLLGTSPYFWMSLQTTYDIRTEQIELSQSNPSKF